MASIDEIFSRELRWELNLYQKFVVFALVNLIIFRNSVLTHFSAKATVRFVLLVAQVIQESGRNISHWRTSKVYSNDFEAIFGVKYNILEGWNNFHVVICISATCATNLTMAVAQLKNAYS